MRAENEKKLGIALLMDNDPKVRSTGA